MEQVQTPWNGTGRLSQLVTELERQRDSMVDFIADSRELDVVDAPDGTMYLKANSCQVGEWLTESTPITDKALGQIGQRVDPDVPVSFLRRLASQRPTLCADLLTKLMHGTAKRRLIRLLDGKVRAFLSDRYLCIDHYALAFSALDAVKASNGNVVSATLTEDNMRLKFTTNEVWDSIDNAAPNSHGFINVRGMGANSQYSESIGLTGNDMPGGIGTVVPTCTLSNSETGNGRLILELGVLNSYCMNTCLMDESVARVHLGETMEVGVYTPETIRLETAAIMAKIKDAITAAFHPATFGRMVDRLRSAKDTKIQSPAPAVTQCVKEHGLPESYIDDLLAYFVREEQTAYGMGQAVSRFAQDFHEDPDKSYELEKVAGAVYNKPQSVAV